MTKADDAEQGPRGKRSDLDRLNARVRDNLDRFSKRTGTRIGGTDDEDEVTARIRRFAADKGVTLRDNDR